MAPDSPTLVEDRCTKLQLELNPVKLEFDSQRTFIHCLHEAWAKLSMDLDRSTDNARSKLAISNNLLPFFLFQGFLHFLPFLLNGSTQT